MSLTLRGRKVNRSEVRKELKQELLKEWSKSAKMTNFVSEP